MSYMGWIIPVSQVLRCWGNLEKLWVWIPQIMCRETWKIIQSLQLLVSHKMRSYSSVHSVCHWLLWVFVGWVIYTCFPGIGAIWGNWAQISQIMPRNTWKVIQRLQLLIQHQMKSYSYTKVIWGFSYICLMGIGALGQFGETGPKYPQITWSNTWKV